MTVGAVDCLFSRDYFCHQLFFGGLEKKTVMPFDQTDEFRKAFGVCLGHDVGADRRYRQAFEHLVQCAFKLQQTGMGAAAGERWRA